MSYYLGDFTEDYATLNLKFTSRQVSGAPFTLAGTPVISIYKANGLTQSVAGVTLTVDFDAVTGLNNVLIDLSSDVFYAIANDYQVVITTGTVNGVSVVGEVVGEFSIENRFDETTLAAKVHTGATVPIVTTLTGHTPQTGDSYLGATAHGNLTLQYDTTGLTGDTFPATQAQAGNIASGSGSIGANVTGATITTGVETLTFTETQELDGVYHEVAPSAGTTDFEYTATLTGNGFLTGATWKGYLQSNNDSYEFQFYDWVSASFKTERVIDAANGTTLVEEFIPAVGSYTGTGVNTGQVRFRVLSTTGTNIATDRFTFEYTIANQSIGYEGQQVFIDTVDGEAGTIEGINGVGDNASLTLADALSLLTITNLHKLSLSPESSITLAAAYTNSVITGTGSTLALGGQQITGSHFFSVLVSGIATTLAGYRFHNSRLTNITIGSGGHFENCTMDGTFTLSNAGVYMFHAISMRLTPTLDFSLLGGATVNFYEFSGDLIVANMAAGDILHITGSGDITVNTSTGGTIQRDGFFKYTDTGGNVVEEVADIELGVEATLLDTGTTLPAQISALNNVAATEIVSAGAITTLSGAVVNVDLVDTTTTNTDMRGTDGANTTAPDNASITLILADTADMQPKLGTPAADISADIAAVKVDTSTNLPALIDDLAVKKNTVLNNFEFLMVLASDHVTPATGLTVTGQRSIDGGAFAAVSGTIAEVSNGIYQFDALAADTNGDLITWRFLSATADDAFVTFKTVA